MLALAAGNANAGANLITNGSFETGDFTGWTLSGNTTYTGVTDVPLYGTLYAEDGNDYAYLGPVGSDGYLSQTFTDSPGVLYSVSLFFASDGETPNDFGVTGPGSLVLSTIYDVPNTYGWVGYFGKFTGSGSDTITFNYSDDNGFLALDNVSVTVPEPSVWAMLILGMAGLGVVLRRRRATAIAAA
jgi:hypothetical protein